MGNRVSLRQRYGISVVQLKSDENSRIYEDLEVSQITDLAWERSASVVECLTRDRGAADSIITGVTALCH